MGIRVYLSGKHRREGPRPGRPRGLLIRQTPDSGTVGAFPGSGAFMGATGRAGASLVWTVMARSRDYEQEGWGQPGRRAQWLSINL